MLFGNNDLRFSFQFLQVKGSLQPASKKDFLPDDERFRHAAAMPFIADRKRHIRGPDPRFPAGCA
jgi:hypothetical protein